VKLQDRTTMGVGTHLGLKEKGMRATNLKFKGGEDGR